MYKLKNREACFLIVQLFTNSTIQSDNKLLFGLVAEVSKYWFKTHISIKNYRKIYSRTIALRPNYHRCPSTAFRLGSM